MQYLYHFTSQKAAEKIVADGSILLGRFLSSNGVVMENSAVSLTTDKDPVGHGLPDGREITPKQAETLKYYTIINDRLHSINNIKCRITIAPTGLDIVSASEYYKNSPDLLRGLSIAAYFPVGFDGIGPTHEKDILIKSKASTWWYSFAPITVASNIISFGIDITGEGKHYEELSPPDFQQLCQYIHQ
ncbi:TPA: hypothetical protein ACOEF8_003540 [Enterobacter roggenkampii]